MKFLNLSFFLFTILMVVDPACSDENDQDEVKPIDLATMIWLEREGLFDPKVPNSEVHQILKVALKHEDSKIFNCAIGSMAWFIGISREVRIQGGTPKFDRELSDIPDLYDLLIGIWEKGWEEADGVVPELVLQSIDVVEERTGCMSVPGDPNQLWVVVPGILAFLYPRDDKVYEIIWSFCPQIGPESLLMGLYEGKFNNPQDQQFRIDILRNVETGRHWSSLAARSLGDFRSAQGLETLVDVLEADEMIYGTPKFVIVEALMKYEKDAVPHIPLIRETLDSALPVGRKQETLKITLRERFIHFEKEFGEQVLEVMESPNP